MDFIPYVDPKQKLVALRNDQLRTGYDAFIVGQLPPGSRGLH